MNLTYETINMMLLLIPGLISSLIYNLIRRKNINNVDKLIESLIFTFLIYFSVNILYTWSPLAEITVLADKQISYNLTKDIKLMALTLSLSILLPIIFGTIVHYDLHMKLFRLLRITDRTSRDTAWDDVFTDEKRFLTLHLNNNKRITGWPLYYSNSDKEGFIYLSQAAWIDSDNSYIDTKSHGILFKRDLIDHIEFMYNPEHEYEQKHTTTNA